MLEFPSEGGNEGKNVVLFPSNTTLIQECCIGENSSLLRTGEQWTKNGYRNGYKKVTEAAYGSPMLVPVP